MSNKQPNVNNWLIDEEFSGKFLMLPPDLFEYKAFQELSNAAKSFYILLNCHKQTEIQRSCLFKALHEYNAILSLGLTDEDICNEARPNKKTRYSHGYFVIPASHLEKYGYSPQYASKLKNELIEKGFIRVMYGKKGRFNSWNTNVCVYQFIGDWKTKHT